MVPDFDTWLAIGIEHGYCSSVYCDTHDGYPPEQEAKDEIEDLLTEYEGDWDFCWAVVHLYGG